MAKSTSKPSALQKHFLDFDIDNYLNPICPRPRYHLLPTFVSFWFGYRAPDSKPQPKLPNMGIWLSGFLGGFIGIAIITNVYQALPMLGNHQVPVIIGSFGAAAILEYNAIESPLSQPRNLILGHFLAAVVGVAVTKGFERLPYERFEELRWLAGSIAVGLASFVMGATKTVHPPAGATALLAATSTEITVLGWWLLPLVLLAATLMCASASLVNNLTRRWPLYWWTPADLSKKMPDILHVKDVEKQVDESKSERSESTVGSLTHWDSRLEKVDTNTESEAKTDHRPQNESQRHENSEHTIVITANEIVLPDWWKTDDWENEVLEIFKTRLNRQRSSLPSNHKTSRPTLAQKDGSSEHMQASQDIDDARTSQPLDDQQVRRSVHSQVTQT